MRVRRSVTSTRTDRTRFVPEPLHRTQSQLPARVYGRASLRTPYSPAHVWGRRVSPVRLVFLQPPSEERGERRVASPLDFLVLGRFSSLRAVKSSRLTSRESGAALARPTSLISAHALPR